MEYPIRWKLPLALEGLESLLSHDWKIYLACPRCRRETIAEPELMSGGAERDIACPSCGAEGCALVRHLEARRCECEDCGKFFTLSSSGLERDQCPGCSSRRLLLVSASIQPPFPPQFDKLLCARDQPWGVSETDDARQIQQDVQSTNFLPDFPSHLLVAVRFCERLRSFGGYAKQDGHLLNLEALMYKEYFRRTGELEAGLAALARTEACITASDEPINVALMEHNVAMDIYSLLSRYSEEIVEALSQRRHLRHEGIERARRALRFFEANRHAPRLAEVGFDTVTLRGQIARIQHIIGDLLKLDGATSQELREAVECLSEAIESGALKDRLEAGARISRAAAIERMSDPQPALLDLAIEDYTAALATPEENRAWSERWITLMNLSSCYRQRGNLAKALRYGEEAVRFALGDLQSAIDDDILVQKGNQYRNLFDLVAGLHAQNGQAERALSTIEAFRATALRMMTMPEKERAKQREDAAKAIMTAGIERLFGDATPKPATNPENILPALKPLRKTLAGTRTILVSLSVAVGEATAIVVGPPALFGDGLRLVRWKLDPKSIDVFGQFFDLPSGAAREKLLARLCPQGHEALLRPWLPELRQLGIAHIGLSTPSIFGMLPFEAFAAAAGEEVAFFSLPSLTVGADLFCKPPWPKSPTALLVTYAGADLPETRREVNEIREIFTGRVNVFESDVRSKAELLVQLQQPHDCIHFACHGSFDLLAPLESALHLHHDPRRDSQRLTARDVLELKFSGAPLVTLSACSTALVAPNPASTHAGLSGSFLRTGARGVIASRWPVGDAAARSFMVQLYAKLRAGKETPWTCFTQVQREFKRTGGIEDWAAFSYLGIP